MEQTGFLDGFRIEHELLQANLRTLYELVGNASSATDPSPWQAVDALYAQARAIHAVLQSHCLVEEHTLFPEVQRLLHAGEQTPLALDVARFLSPGLEGGVRVHHLLCAGVEQVVHTLERWHSATTLPPQVRTQLKETLEMVNEMFAGHLDIEQTVIYAFCERAFTTEDRARIQQQLQTLLSASERAQPSEIMRLLVAEDDAAAAIFLTETLADPQRHITVVTTGQEALEACLHGGFDIVILDWILPELDGAALAHLLRQSASGKFLYIMMISGKATSHDLVAGLEAGADDYLLKPLRAEELRARIRVGERVVRLHRERASVQAQLLSLALTDEVTGLLNRRAILQRLESEIARSHRHHTPLHLLLFDIDSFKLINDRYGHNAGDRVLRAFAQRLLPQLRVYDTLGRYGGDEFLAILPGVTGPQARDIAVRMRAVINERPFLFSEHDTGSVAASFGIAEWIPKTGLLELLAAADRALYIAKFRGGNCISDSSDNATTSFIA